LNDNPGITRRIVLILLSHPEQVVLIIVEFRSVRCYKIASVDDFATLGSRDRPHHCDMMPLCNRVHPPKRHPLFREDCVIIHGKPHGEELGQYQKIGTSPLQIPIKHLREPAAILLRGLPQDIALA
jgi:hypothetical protein